MFASRIREAVKFESLMGKAWACRAAGSWFQSPSGVCLKSGDPSNQVLKMSVWNKWQNKLADWIITWITIK